MRKILFVLLSLFLIGSVFGQPVMSFNNIAELVSPNTKPQNFGRKDSGGILRATVFVRGYYTPNDGGEATYDWQENYSGQTNAYGGAFSVTGGAWVARGPLNIANFGAKKNDADYDNTIHIQAAIDWANSGDPPSGWPDVENSTIIVPFGDWHIDAGGLLLKEGVTLEGEGEQGAEIVITWRDSLTASSLTQSGGTATLTTSSAHNLVSGDFIVITGADQSDYNEIHHITVTGANTLTFPVDAGAVSPATGTLVITAHPFAIQNWRESIINEFASVDEKQSNFGLRNLTISIDRDADSPEGVYALRLANTVEAKIHNVRFRMHRSPNGGANLTSAIWVELCDDLDFDNIGVDQGITAIKSSTRFGASYGYATARIRNLFLFSQIGKALDINTGLIGSWEGIMIRNSGGDQSSEPNIQVYIDENSYENKFDGLILDRFANYGVIVYGPRNTFDGTHIYWSTRDNNVNYDKIGFDIYGDDNVFSDIYLNGAIIGFRFNDGAENNVIRGLVTKHSDTPVQGLTSANVYIPDRNDAPPAVWNFPGLTSNADGTWISSTLTDTIDSGEAFSIMVTGASYTIPEISTGTQSQGLIAIGNTQIPAAGNGSFRLGVDLTGRLFATFYGATSSDRRLWQTPTNTFPLNQRTTIYFSRDSSGNVTFRINGQLIEDLEVNTAGTPPSATDAITGDYLSIGRIAASTTWTGWISEAGVFNRALTLAEQTEFENGTLSFSPALRRGQDETDINGTFESGTTGWAAVAGGAIAQTNVAHTGTYSLLVAASSTGDGTATSGQIPNTSGLVKYLVTGYVKWISGTGSWQIGRADSTDLQAVTVPTDGTWYAISYIIGGKVGQPSGVLRFLSADGAGEVCLDQIAVRRYGALGAFSAESEIYNGTILAWDNETVGTIVNDGIESRPIQSSKTFIAVNNISELVSSQNNPEKYGRLDSNGILRATVFVRGYYEPGDGGAAIYNWDENFSGTTNSLGGALSVAGGTWVLDKGELITPYKFGAKFDGVTDDTAAFQAADDYCASLSPRGTVWVPGTSNIEDTLGAVISTVYVSVNWRSLDSLNRASRRHGTVLKHKAGATGSMFIIGDNETHPVAETVTIEGIHFLGKSETNLRDPKTITAVTDRLTFEVDPGDVPTYSPSSRRPYYGLAGLFSDENRFIGSVMVKTVDTMTGVITVEPGTDNYATSDASGELLDVGFKVCFPQEISVTNFVGTVYTGFAWAAGGYAGIEIRAAKGVNIRDCAFSRLYVGVVQYNDNGPQFEGYNEFTYCRIGTYVNGFAIYGSDTKVDGTIMVIGNYSTDTDLVGTPESYTWDNEAFRSTQVGWHGIIGATSLNVEIGSCVYGIIFENGNGSYIGRALVEGPIREGIWYWSAGSLYNIFGTAQIGTLQVRTSPHYDMPTVRATNDTPLIRIDGNYSRLAIDNIAVYDFSSVGVSTNWTWAYLYDINSGTSNTLSLGAYTDYGNYVVAEHPSSTARATREFEARLILDSDDFIDGILQLRRAGSRSVTQYLSAFLEWRFDTNDDGTDDATFGGINASTTIREIQFGPQEGDSSGSSKNVIIDGGYYTGTDAERGQLIFQAPQGSGNNSANGAIVFQTPDVTASGTDAQTTSTKLTISSGGGLTLYSKSTAPTENVDAAQVYFNTTSDRIGLRTSSSYDGSQNTIVPIMEDVRRITNPAAPSTDDTYTGNAIGGLNNSGGVTQWDTVYLNSSSQWVLADANGTGTYPARGIAIATVATGNSTTVMVRGTIRNDAWNWTPGGTIYLSATAGGMTQTAPSTSGDKVQQIGFALSADVAYFDFASGEYLTVE